MVQNHMTEDRLARLARRVSLQRAALTWETVWAGLHWPLIILGVAIIAVTSGLLQTLPLEGRWAAVDLLAAGFLAALIPLLRLVLPSEASALRHMEQAAALPHRKLSSKDEGVARELADAETSALWAEHKRRQLAGLEHIPVVPPRSGWRSFDPRALRVPVMLGVFASLMLGSGQISSTFSGASLAPAAPAGVSAAIDAWLKPPAYTAKPPLLLTSAALQDKLAKGEDILVPENSVLSVRATGYATPNIVFLSDSGQPLADIVATTKLSDSGYTAETKLTRPMIIRMMDGNTQLAQWPIAVVPDAPPSITFPKPHEIETGGALTLHWEAKDDYGVRKVTSEVELADEQADGVGFSSDGPFLYDPPGFPVALKKSNAKTETGKSTHDLTAHPWAGLNITLTLTARDGGGLEGTSEPLTLTMPERPFTRPLAKALIEQRKRLVMVPDRAIEIAQLFDALLLYPDGLIDRSGIHIRLAAIISHLENSANNEDIKTAVADLWQLALDVEDGSLADAKAELAALKKQLEDAIKNGASEQEIARLMDKMREAMNRYMDAMRKEAEKNRQAGRNPPQDQNQQQGEQRQVSREDLQRMMDEIERLTKEGKQDQAQALLDELDRMLQNMQPGDPNQMAQGQGDPMGEMLDQLQEMMRQQQRLMDDTQRMPGDGQQPGQQGQQGEGQQPGEGQMGQNGQQPGQSPGGLSQRQGSLGDMLRQLMDELGQNSPGSLGEAEREMRGAQGSLNDSNRDSALEQQGNALDELRKGAGEMRRQMRQGQGQARNRGRDGEATGREDDPLGRPRATRNADEGPDEDIVPSELAGRRAREILEQLRARANEQGLTEQERGYIERLLRGLY